MHLLSQATEALATSCSREITVFPRVFAIMAKGKQAAGQKAAKTGKLVNTGKRTKLLLMHG